MKHTKEPWDYDAFGDWHSFACNTELIDDYDFRIEWHKDMPEDERIANAHLIATAPILLKALKELCELPNKHRPERIWEEAKTAIARAEGE